MNTFSMSNSLKKHTVVPKAGTNQTTYKYNNEPYRILWKRNIIPDKI